MNTYGSVVDCSQKEGIPSDNTIYKGEIIMKNITSNTELTRNLNGGHWLWDVAQWLWEQFPKAYHNACQPKPKVSKW